jgi:hypothetical protein
LETRGSSARSTSRTPDGQGNPMAIDNTPPRLKLIATIAIITVVTLIGIDFVLKSYYAMMTDEASREKLAPTSERDTARKAEQAALTGATLPIDQAMGQIAKGTRPEAITPQPSEDLAAMTGWSKLPKPAPTPQPHAAVPPPAMAGDGGVMLAGDGGAPHAGDAGAPRAGHGGDAGAAHPGYGGGDAGVRRRDHH